MNTRKFKLTDRSICHICKTNLFAGDEAHYDMNYLGKVACTTCITLQNAERGGIKAHSLASVVEKIGAPDRTG